MSKFNYILLLILLLSSDCFCRRFGGGFRSRGSSFRSRGSSSSASRRSSFRRNPGYGTYTHNPAPRTSLYTRSYGSYSGRRSSSYNGFGLGMGKNICNIIVIILTVYFELLGVGFLFGYRFGALSRPIGYNSRGYGYNYIHKDRNYNMQKPYHCAATNVR